MQDEFLSGDDGILLRSGSPASRAQALPGVGESTAAAADCSSATFVRAIIRARALRRQFFDQHLFSDPAWDILLELYALKCEGVRVSVSKLSVAADVPSTTALRWIDKLQSEWLIVRAEDPLDGRRVWVELSDLGFGAMRTYLQRISNPGLAI